MAAASRRGRSALLCAAPAAYDRSVGALLYFSACGVSGLASAVLGRVAWRRRREAAAAAPLASFFMAVALWDVAYAVDSIVGPSRVGLTVVYVGVALATPSAFVFVARLGRFDRLGSRAAVRMLGAIACIIVALVAMDGQLGLLFGGYTGDDLLQRRHAGPLFWLNIAYDYALLCAITVMVVMYLRRNRQRLFRRQFTAMLTGVLVPWLSSLGLVFSLTPYDVTPIALSVTALSFGVAMWRYRGLSVAPIARHHVVERMADGVIVLDDHGMISDINPAAARMFRARGDVLGTQLDRMPVLANALSGVDLSRETPAFAFAIPGSGAQIHVEISAHLLEDRSGRRVGSLIVARDVTTRVELEDELARLATTDPLTGVGNRRRFDERLTLEYDRALRSGRPLSLAIIDLDHLKEVNDAGGHRAGDDALRRVAEHMRTNVRRTDLVSRIGGDEFGVLLPETASAEAAMVLRRVADAVAQDRDATLAGHITVSIGLATIAASEHSATDLVRQADDAMYRAKQAGRNRLDVAEPPARARRDSNPQPTG